MFGLPEIKQMNAAAALRRTRAATDVHDTSGARALVDAEVAAQADVGAARAVVALDGQFSLGVVGQLFRELQRDGFRIVMPGSDINRVIVLWSSPDDQI